MQKQLDIDPYAYAGLLRLQRIQEAQSGTPMPLSSVVVHLIHNLCYGVSTLNIGEAGKRVLYADMIKNGYPGEPFNPPNQRELLPVSRAVSAALSIYAETLEDTDAVELECPRERPEHALRCLLSQKFMSDDQIHTDAGYRIRQLLNLPPGEPLPAPEGRMETGLIDYSVSITLFTSDNTGSEWLETTTESDTPLEALVAAIEARKSSAVDENAQFAVAKIETDDKISRFTACIPATRLMTDVKWRELA